jgi:glycosyltransferase involved in cell wall biosynthesis
VPRRPPSRPRGHRCRTPAADAEREAEACATSSRSWAGGFVHGEHTQARRSCARAAALVYPSLYEGFGILPLEAMSLGCPVVCGAVASLPEVAGDAAELVDLTDAASLAAGLEKVVLASAHAAAGRRSGQRARQFSWDRCPADTRDVYRALA